jgi:Protein of unknown function (DUF3465)
VRTASALLAALFLVACGGRDQPDDQALHNAIKDGRAGAEVTFEGTVAAAPQQIGGHEHLVVTTPLGDRLEVDHNTSLAPSVPAKPGDQVVVHGELYIDPGQVGVHCTHAHTSSGCPYPGWIELAGNYYE